ncbi:hypothetical protein PPERSA_09769 [Pseudocohnilembus persalinus]|uniref:Uncharacterized protein n=1 Tax=Pseudocohnilembus persalinus TaxID=266149 RepID=A0A0V0QU05_PSEPJ|nr:hypothetical protein PPERSA_09769 [Pseudocohnilembus persalinus]|eukprot:KRX05629.1 hypothetical protein PPERSA_09769 [Pseudocohnilembus persalinus]
MNAYGIITPQNQQYKNQLTSTKNLNLLKKQNQIKDHVPKLRQMIYSQIDIQKTPKGKLNNLGHEFNIDDRTIIQNKLQKIQKQNQSSQKLKRAFTVACDNKSFQKPPFELNLNINQNNNTQNQSSKRFKSRDKLRKKILLNQQYQEQLEKIRQIEKIKQFDKIYDQDKEVQKYFNGKQNEFFQQKKGQLLTLSNLKRQKIKTGLEDDDIYYQNHEYDQIKENPIKYQQLFQNCIKNQSVQTLSLLQYIYKKQMQQQQINNESFSYDINSKNSDNQDIHQQYKGITLANWSLIKEQNFQIGNTMSDFQLLIQRQFEKQFNEMLTLKKVNGHLLKCALPDNQNKEIYKINEQKQEQIRNSFTNLQNSAYNYKNFSQDSIKQVETQRSQDSQFSFSKSDNQIKQIQEGQNCQQKQEQKNEFQSSFFHERWLGQNIDRKSHNQSQIYIQDQKEQCQNSLRFNTENVITKQNQNPLLNSSLQNVNQHQSILKKSSILKNSNYQNQIKQNESFNQ